MPKLGPMLDLDILYGLDKDHIYFYNESKGACWGASWPHSDA
jgi:hypothetical protein